MINPQTAFEKLAQFDTADEIAQYLQHLGIKGHRTSSTHCPISQFMSERTGLVVSTGSAVRTFANVEYWKALEHNFKAPVTDAMCDFIARFDRGRYPELIDTTTERIAYA